MENMYLWSKLLSIYRCIIQFITSKYKIRTDKTKDHRFLLFLLQTRLFIRNKNPSQIHYILHVYRPMQNVHINFIKLYNRPFKGPLHFGK